MRTAVEMARAVREREVSPVELVEDALRRADAWQPVTNAFSQLHAEEALAEARRKSEDVASERDLGPLHGVPVAVKDLFDVAGWETTGCCEAYRGRPAERDAEAVRRLRAAGAVIVGKTNQHELAAGATNLISACGATRNPWDPSRITGGSSGGSGAAVAAGVVPVALGTDTGGSIRIPASMCGVSGLKPTHGSISLEGVMPLAPSLDTVGPLARTGEDCAVLLSVLGGDPAIGAEVGGPLGDLTVGSLGTLYVAFLHREVLDASLAAVDVFGELGAVTTGVLGEGTFAPEVWEEIAWPELAQHHGGLLDRRDLLHDRTAELLARGAGQPEEVMAEARRRAAEVREAFLSALTVVDVLLAAATPIVAPPAGADWVEVGSGRVSVRHGAPSLLTRSVNLAGLPAMAVPGGFSSDGLPIGIQLIGRPGEEAVLLRAARAFQGATDHHRAEPELPTGSG
ncbi:MAG: amidase [Actinomycetota bacterium]